MGLKRSLSASLLLLLLGCQTNGTAPDAPQVSGNWRWVSSSGSIAGRTYTPMSEGYNVRFVFDGNHLRAFRNDSLIATSQITLAGDEITYQPSLSVFVFGGLSDTQTIQVLGGDTLALADPCCDRFSHLLVRLP